VLRGGAWNNNADNARCAVRNRNDPDNRNNNIGFSVVLRSPTFFRPFFWLRVHFWLRHAQRRFGIPVPLPSGNAGRCVQTRLPAEAKEEEQHQTGLVRPQAAGWGRAIRGVARGGRIWKLGHGQAGRFGPPCPPQVLAPERVLSSTVGTKDVPIQLPCQAQWQLYRLTQPIASFTGLPTRLNISTSVSMVNLAVFLFTTSDTRGRDTISIAAASACFR
jgi:hypothetical protein